MNRTQEYFRFKWSHEMKAHRLAVRVYNALMRFIPFRIKYVVGRRMRSRSYPYVLVHEGSVIVQVGAPQDTLHSGRSRAMYFSLFTGKQGKVVIVEPDADSLHQYELAAKKWGFQNMVLCPSALWSEKKTLRIFINDAHPASSFTEGTKEYDAEVMREYQAFDIQADTLDNILIENGIDHVDLVSITTNGAEKEILQGMKNTISKGLTYICLARTGPDYIEMMSEIDYKLYSFDDRGYTFVYNNPQYEV